ncbi:unnamed protein product [Rhodiola kirilowii]
MVQVFILFSLFNPFWLLVIPHHILINKLPLDQLHTSISFPQFCSLKRSE